MYGGGACEVEVNIVQFVRFLTAKKKKQFLATVNFSPEDTSDQRDIDIILKRSGASKKQVK